MADSLTNGTDLLRQMTVRSSTKDSLVISWEVANGFTAFVNGYRVRYQAIGSAIVQDSPMLSSTSTSFDITQLHENTLYAVCLTVFTNTTAGPGAAGPGAAGAAGPGAAGPVVPVEWCLRAATSTHSLSVALGSTFGAFLALGVVVMFVLLAKWQHFRRNRKLFQQQILTADSTESIDDICIIQENGDIELNCLEVCGGGGNSEGEMDQTTTTRKDGSSPTSEFSADVLLHGASVCSVDAGPGSDPARGQRVLIGLDGYSCANSFILTSPSRDSKTGISYSLLVPLPASGVLPFMVQQDQMQGPGQGPGQGHGQGHGQGRDEKLQSSAASSRPNTKVKYQHPVVRLKLRKHPTVDYSSTDDGWQHITHLAQHLESAHEQDQSRDQTTTTTTTTTTAAEADKPSSSSSAAAAAASTQLNENRVDEGDPDNSGSGNDKDTSGAPNGLLNTSADRDSLPRSLSNTW